MKKRGVVAVLIIGVLAVVIAMAATLMVSIGNEVKIVRLQERQLQNQQIDVARELLRKTSGDDLQLPAELK